MALEEISNYRLRESMLPFSFQIISVWHTPLALSKACVRDSLCHRLTDPVSIMRAYVG